MSKRRAKIAAGATVLGLGALGGVALGTNPGMPATTGPVASASGSAPIVTGASGAAAVPAARPVAARTASGTRPPIVTRASGGGAIRSVEFDD